MTSENGQPDDAELVVLTLAGDEDAFGRLFDRYARLVRAAVVGSARNEATVHDLTQEVFVRAFRKLATLRDPLRFKSWILGFARHVSLEQCRTMRRDRHCFVANDVLDAVAHQSPMQSQDIWDQLQSLPERERLVIQAFFLNKNDAEATGELLEMSRSTVYALLKQACQRLAQANRLDEVASLKSNGEAE